MKLFNRTPKAAPVEIAEWVIPNASRISASVEPSSFIWTAILRRSSCAVAESRRPSTILIHQLYHALAIAGCLYAG
jgi:hypothetical protein